MRSPDDLKHGGYAKLSGLWLQRGVDRRFPIPIAERFSYLNSS